MIRAQHKFLLAIVSAAILLGFAYRKYAAARSEVSLARADLEECKTISKQIVQLRERPTVAADYGAVAFDISKRIDESCVATGIESESVVRIDPGREQRIAESDYVEIRTTTELERIRISQLIAFIYEVESRGPNVLASSIRLRPQPINANDETWTAEVSFRNLFHKPSQR